jgi:ketosteroid isomerase-like protein
MRSLTMPGSLLLTAISLAFTVPVAAQTSATSAADSAAVAHVIEQFHGALARGDSAAVLALLTPDVTIVEAGGVENLQEYRSGHLPGDIEYAKALPRRRGALKVTLRGDVAWASSLSTVQGEYRGRAVNSASAELMVLVRVNGQWRISAIHWSSRAIRS